MMLAFSIDGWCSVIPFSIFLYHSLCGATHDLLHAIQTLHIEYRKQHLLVGFSTTVTAVSAVQ